MARRIIYRSTCEALTKAKYKRCPVGRLCRASPAGSTQDSRGWWDPTAPVPSLQNWAVEPVGGIMYSALVYPTVGIDGGAGV